MEDFLRRVRESALEYLSRSDFRDADPLKSDGYLFRLVLEHEQQHQETLAYLMHLRFERMSLVLTLIPTLVVCICLLFIVFPDSFRTKEIRATHTSAEPAAGSAPAPGH